MTKLNVEISQVVGTVPYPCEKSRRDVVNLKASQAAVSESHKSFVTPKGEYCTDTIFTGVPYAERRGGVTRRSVHQSS